VIIILLCIEEQMISRCMESPPVALHTGNNLSPLWRSSKIKKKASREKTN
jgi:hypothetical protein